MNRTIRFAAAAVAAGFILAPAAQASGPNTGEQRAAEAAKKGPAELRRFIQRTRMIYGLTYEQFRSNAS